MREFSAQIIYKDCEFPRMIEIQDTCCGFSYVAKTEKTTEFQSVRKNIRKWGTRPSTVIAKRHNFFCELLESMPDCNADFQLSAKSENWQNNRVATHLNKSMRLLQDRLPVLDLRLGSLMPLDCERMNY